MKFSVIVPVYNVEDYLKDCIESILSQTFEDFEIILVNDGSTDDSGIICNKYAALHSDRILVISKNNQGLISARREGIKYARGEFIVFVDSDDFIDKHLLSIVNDALSSEESIDIVLYSLTYMKNGNKEGRFKRIAEDGTTWSGENKRELYDKLITSSDVSSLCTKAIRAELLKRDSDNYSKYYGKNMAEDLLQSLYPITYARKIKYLDKALYVYRINEKSISNSMNVKDIKKKNSIHVYKKIREYCSIWEINTDENKKKLDARWFNDTMYIALKCYEREEKYKGKKQILSYDWDSMMPQNLFIEDNIYINEFYKKLYLAMKKRRYIYAETLIRKNQIYQFLKKKRKLRSEN